MVRRAPGGSFLPRPPGAGLQTARKPNFVLGDHSSRRGITALAPATYPQVSFARPDRSCRTFSPWRTGPVRAWPRRETRPSPCLFGLAPCGVYHAGLITEAAVRSYRTLSPLPQTREHGRRLHGGPNRPGAVCSLLHWPSSRLEAAVPDVIRHTALWSSDFPPPGDRLRADFRQRSPDRLQRSSYRRCLRFPRQRAKSACYRC